MTLTLNFFGRLGTMWSIYIPNLTEIGQSAAELLMMINDKFFIRFRGCSNTGIGSKKRADRSAPNLLGSLSGNRYTPSLKMWWYPARFPNYSSSKSSVGQRQGQQSHFLNPVKIRGGMGKMIGSILVAAPMTASLVCICWPASPRLLRAVFR